MASWFTFLRSEDDITSTVTVQYGNDVAAELPQRPLAFLIVRNTEVPTDRPGEELEASLIADLESSGAMVVGAIAMANTRTIIAYGSDEAQTRRALGAYDGAVAFQAQPDPEWHIYRALLPSTDEIAASTPGAEPEGA